MRLGILPVLLSLLCACSSATSEPGAAAPTPPDPEPGAPPTPLDWRVCEERFECAKADVPRDYADATKGTLTLALKRAPAKKAKRGTLWLLHGGPGASGVTDFRLLAKDLPALVPDLDIVTLDHRGVGESERLRCTSGEKNGSRGGVGIDETEWPACIAELEKAYPSGGLSAFTTTAAARDVGTLIERTRAEGEQIFVWGGSYGSYLAHRYMQLFPEQPDGVILEGIAPPGFGFEPYSADMDATGKALFEACATDSTCAAHLGPDPWTKAKEVVASFDAGHCPALGVDAAGMKSFLGGLLFYEVVRGAVAPVVFRAERCTKADVAAIVKVASILGGGGARPGLGLGALDDSRLLFMQISQTEFWDGTFTEAAARAEHATLTTATPLTLELAHVAPLWPKTPRDEHFGKLATYTRPLLMLQGGLDPATPAKYTERMRAHFTAPDQTFVLFPHAAHDPTAGTYTASGERCGLSIFARFLEDPKAPVDTTCVADTEGVSFAARGWEAQALFGTASAWD